MLFDDMCIKYSFDLKFAIKESQMKLEYFDHTMKTMIFELPLNDDSVWTAILRKKLNQKGFH